MNKRVIVVEDDMDLAKIIERALRKLDFEVEHFVDGEIFLKASEMNQAAVYLVDIILPGIDGISLLKKIRLNNPLNPIIVISTKNNQNEIIEGLRSGADDYVTKPFEMSELQMRVQVAWKKFEILSKTRS